MCGCVCVECLSVCEECVGVFGVVEGGVSDGSRYVL